MNFIKHTVVFLATVVSILPLIQAASDTLESDLFESQTRESKLHISHGFGHDIHEVQLKPRGVLTIKNFRGPKYNIEQEELTLEETSKLESLANQGGYYFLTVTVKNPTGDKIFRTFFPAKSLVESNLLDEFRIHLNPSGEIFSVSYNTRKPAGKASTAEFPGGHRKPPTQRFTTVLSITHGEVGPIPDTGPYLEKLEMERHARERGEDGRDNRSFLAKYWMYIVPIAVLVLLSSASNPEGGGS